VLFFLISLRRSRGEERREEKRIAGPVSSGCSLSAEGEDWEGEIGGWEEGEAVVGGLEITVGVENSSREA
jgi:hypothetical protein